jgi:5'-3' exonuclease
MIDYRFFLSFYIYRDVTVSSQLGLTRESLINIAMLCGSDYTEGIRGVGPVTAMEILAKFKGKGLESLQKLKSWWEDAQKDVRISVTTSKLLTKLRELDISEGMPKTDYKGSGGLVVKVSDSQHRYYMFEHFYGDSLVSSYNTTSLGRTRKRK